MIIMCKLQKLLGTLFTKCCLSPTFYRRTVSGQQHSLRRIWLIASQPGGCQPVDALGSAPVNWVAIELASSTCNSPTYQVSLSRAKAEDAAPRNIESIQELPWSNWYWFFLFCFFNYFGVKMIHNCSILVFKSEKISISCPSISSCDVYAQYV